MTVVRYFSSNDVGKSVFEVFEKCMPTCKNACGHASGIIMIKWTGCVLKAVTKKTAGFLGFVPSAFWC